MASPSRRVAAFLARPGRRKRALLHPCMLRSALACLDCLVLVIAMFNGDPARFSASAFWHIPSPPPPPLPVLAPSQCPTKTLFLCRERDRPRFSEAEFQLRRDAYDAAKVHYSIFRRPESLGSQMDVEPRDVAVDLEAAGAQSDGTDLCSSDGENEAAGGAAAGEASNASQPSVYNFCEPRVHRQPSIPRAVAMPLLHVAAIAAGSGDFAASCEPASAAASAGRTTSRSTAGRAPRRLGGHDNWGMGADGAWTKASVHDDGVPTMEGSDAEMLDYECDEYDGIAAVCVLVVGGSPSTPFCGTQHLKNKCPKAIWGRA